VRRLHRFLTGAFPFAWRIMIADNASTDATPAIARALAEELRGVTVLPPRPLRSRRSGHGRASPNLGVALAAGALDAE
jgi:glycosyltransferase involved in cell wall biosynthesis